MTRLSDIPITALSDALTDTLGGMIGFLPALLVPLVIMFGYKTIRGMLMYAPAAPRVSRAERRQLEAAAERAALEAAIRAEVRAELDPPKNRIHVERRCKCAYCDPDRYALRDRPTLEPPKSDSARQWARYWDSWIAKV